MKKFLLTLIVTMLTCLGAWAQEIVLSPATDPVTVAVGDTYTFTIQQLTGFDGSNITSSSLTVVEGDASNCSVSVQQGSALTNALYGNVPVNVTPSQAGTYKIRVYLSTKYEYGETKGGNDASKDLTIIAVDPTLATSLSITPASPVTVDKGGTTNVSVDLVPATADLDISAVTGISGVTATLAADKKSITIDATAATSTGEASFTLTPKDGSTASPITVTVNVVAPRVPVTATCPSSIRMGESLNVIATLGGELDANDYTFSYSSDADGVLSVSPNGVLTPKSIGNANITVTVTGGSYAPFSQTFPVTVNKGEYTFTAAADPAFFVVGESGESTLSYSNVQLNGVDATDGFEVSYSPKASKDGVSLYGNTVTVDPSATAGTFTAIATLTPANTDNYEVATAEVNITIGTPAFSLNIEDQSIPKSSYGVALSSFISFNDTNYSNGAEWVFDDPVSGNSDVVTAAWNRKQNNNNYELQLTPHGVGTTTVTLTIHATLAGVESVAKKTFNVTVTGDPLKFTMGDVTINDDQDLTLDVVKAAITKVFTGDENNNPNIVTSGYAVEMKYNDEVVTSVPAQGSDVNSFEITVNVKATDPDYLDATAVTKNVTVTHLKSFTLALPATPSASITDNGQQAVINPSATYTNPEDNTTTPVAITSYDMTYTLSAEGVATVEKDNTTNAITVTGQNPGTVTVTVTAHPTDGSTYATITNTTTITVTESPKVVLTKQTIDGKEFVVVHVPAGGAFGGISDTPKYTSTDETNLDDLKAAVNVKVTGHIANSDVQELVNLIGVTTMGDGNCKTLDMGGATMTEAITNNGYKCSLVGGVDKNGYDVTKSLVSLETLVLPYPATDVPGGTILPKGMSGLHGLWNNVTDNHLQSLTIPEGWTEVAAEAWASNNNNKPELGGTSISLQNLTTLNLPNSLAKVGDWAFSGLGVKALFMPKEIAYIGAAAFSNSPNMSDIYFTGDGSKLKYVDQDAFSHQTQMVNNCINNDNICNDKHMPTMDRSHYVNGGVLACILHYPEGCDAEYTDVTRKYKVVDTSVASGITYGKGNEDSSYIPDGWTAEFKTAVNDASKNEDIMVITANPLMVSGGFPDEVYGYSLIWPSQYQMTSGYAIANAGYLWNGTKMTSEQLDYTDPDNPVDKRGLYQFIVAMGNAPKDKEEWTFDYELDKWYTIALPFDMSPAQIRDVFGPNTQVCRFSGVQRVTDGDDKKIVLEFRKSVMLDGDGRAEDNTYSVVKYENDKPAGTMSMTYEEGGIQHHWPYMIKPGGKAEGQLAMKFKNYNAIPGILNQDKVNSTSSVSSEQPKQYAFCPILTKQYYDGEVNEGGGFKKNSYIFVNKINGTAVPHQYVFFKGIKDGNGGYRDGGTVNAFTAYVQLDHGQDDCDTFFTPVSDPDGQTLAPINASLFGDDEAVNGIEKVVIVCGTDSIDNDKIYTINGVQVNGTHLPAGLYIKNGKKFIVK